MADQNLRDQVALVSYVDDLIRAKNDTTIKPEELPNLRARLLKTVNDAINRRLIGLLRDEQQDELNNLFDNKAADEEINNYFKKAIPNLDVEITTVLLDFRAGYLYSANNPSSNKVD